MPEDVDDGTYDEQMMRNSWYPVNKDSEGGMWTMEHTKNNDEEQMMKVRWQVTST